jgi:siroheme synthase
MAYRQHGQALRTPRQRSEQINALMVWHALETRSRTIVRLKSGDPAVLAGWLRELDALRRAGVEFEIISGITAASAAAAYANHPYRPPCRLNSGGGHGSQLPQ